MSATQNNLVSINVINFSQSRMSMDKQLTINIAVYFPFIFSFIASVVLLWKVGVDVKNNQISKKKGKVIYTVYIVLIGFFSATVIFFGLISLFNISSGHGYGYIAIPVLHVFLSTTLILIGRVIIGWEDIKY